MVDSRTANQIANKFSSEPSQLEKAKYIYLGPLTITDIGGTNGVTFISPIAGKLTRAISVVSGNPGAATALAVAINGGSAVGTITVANGAAANELDSVDIASNNTVAEGSRISITSDGGGTNAVNSVIMITIEHA